MGQVAPFTNCLVMGLDALGGLLWKLLSHTAQGPKEQPHRRDVSEVTPLHDALGMVVGGLDALATHNRATQLDAGLQNSGIS